MKGIKFYLEYPSKAEKKKGTRTNLGNHSGNCIAVIEENKMLQYSINRCFPCITSVFDYPNSDVTFDAISPDYLNNKCKLISEKQAKVIHPKLFEYLEIR